MDDYISREAAISKILSDPTDAHYPSWYAEKLKQIPAADVRPVVKAQWVPNVPHRDLRPRCTACGMLHPVRTNFCPNCGADMREAPHG
jgi:hypothetical protein